VNENIPAETALLGLGVMIGAAAASDNKALTIIFMIVALLIYLRNIGR
jgi:hypothetical protein